MVAVQCGRVRMGLARAMHSRVRSGPADSAGITARDLYRELNPTTPGYTTMAYNVTCASAVSSGSLCGAWCAMSAPAVAV